MKMLYITTKFLFLAEKSFKVKGHFVFYVLSTLELFFIMTRSIKVIKFLIIKSCEPSLLLITFFWKICLKNKYHKK